MALGSPVGRWRYKFSEKKFCLGVVRCRQQASRACVAERSVEDRQQASVLPMPSNAATVATSPDDGGCGGTSANFVKFSIEGLKNG